MDIPALQKTILEFAEERDWLQFHTPKNLSMAIASEAAELMELFLWCDSAESHKLLADGKVRQQIEEELADVLIFSLQLANIGKIDLDRAIRKKIARNAEKYPVEKAKGSSRKYTEL